MEVCERLTRYERPRSNSSWAPINHRLECVMTKYIILILMKNSVRCKSEYECYSSLQWIINSCLMDRLVIREILCTLCIKVPKTPATLLIISSENFRCQSSVVRLKCVVEIILWGFRRQFHLNPIGNANHTEIICRRLVVGCKTHRGCGVWNLIIHIEGQIILIFPFPGMPGFLIPLFATGSYDRDQGTFLFPFMEVWTGVVCLMKVP